MEITQILFALSLVEYRIFRHGARSGDHFCSSALTFYFRFSDYETVAKVIGGGGGAAFYTKRSLGEPAVRPYGKTFSGRTQSSPLRKKYSFDREMVLA